MKFGIRELLFLVVMLGLLGSTYFFVFAKANTRTTLLREEIASRQQALANLRTTTAGIDDLGRKIDELQRAIHFFESKLPKEKEIDDILKQVWQMAGNNNLELKTVKPLKSERGPNYSEQPIEMKLAGSFEGFYSFMLELEKMQRITRVSAMKLAKIDDRDGEMQADLTLSIFFEPDTRAPNPADTAAGTN
jgi:type IV pilus assembly protein PilO